MTLEELRRRAREGRDPTCAPETLAKLLSVVRDTNASRYLEIGAAEGLTTCAVLLQTEGAAATAIELDPGRAARARENFSAFGVAARAELIEGDAGEILPLLAGEYDVIFLDGPKAQYLKYLPHCKRLLRRGGTLLSDDVLLYGWTFGTPPPKRKSLALRLRAYLEALESDPAWQTELFRYGEGLAVSKKL